MTLVALPIDVVLWRVEWGFWATAAGLLSALAFRRRPARALALVLVGCTAWAIWILPVHKQVAVLWLGPVAVAVAAGAWLSSGTNRTAVGSPMPLGWGVLAVRMDASLVWVLTVISVGGVWLAVPETAVNVVIMMAVIPVAGVAWWDADRPQWPVRLGAVALVVIGSFSGAAGRTAWIGGLACVGLIPFGRRDDPWVILLVVHWLVVLAACRVVSRWQPIPATLGSLGLVLGGWAIVEISSTLRRQPMR